MHRPRILKLAAVADRAVIGGNNPLLVDGQQAGRDVIDTTGRPGASFMIVPFEGTITFGIWH
jgi:hypothetical protein